MPNEEGKGEISSKSARLLEVFRRMKLAPAPSSFDEAYRLLCRTIDQVEDELTGLPNEPARWRESGRLHAPQRDRMSSIANCEVKRFDSLRHLTYIAPNGALEIRTKRLVSGAILVHFSKPGGDGRSVSEVCPQLSERNL